MMTMQKRLKSVPLLGAPVPAQKLLFSTFPFNGISSLPLRLCPAQEELPNPFGWVTQAPCFCDTATLAVNREGIRGMPRHDVWFK